MSMKERLDRVEAAIDNAQCSMCCAPNSPSQLLVAGGHPERYICEECIQASHDTFRNQAKFHQLVCGTACDFCGTVSETAVPLVHKPGITLCMACIDLCMNLVQENRASIERYGNEFPNYFRILKLEWRHQRQLAEYTDEFLFKRLPTSKFHRVMRTRRLPKHWARKFSEEDLNNRLTSLESIAGIATS